MPIVAHDELMGFSEIKDTKVFTCLVVGVNTSLINSVAICDCVVIK